MGGWNLELTIVSATNLPNVRNWSFMKVYALVYIVGNPESALKTPVDYDGETNPKWNFNAPFVLSEQAVQGEGEMLRIALYCERTFQDPKYVAELELSVKSLFKNRYSQPEPEYSVVRANEEGSFGQLKISYRFDEIVGTTSKATSPAAAGEGGGSEVWEQVVSGASSVVKFVAKETAAVVLESLIPGSSTILEVWE